MEVEGKSLRVIPSKGAAHPQPGLPLMPNSSMGIPNMGMVMPPPMTGMMAQPGIPPFGGVMPGVPPPSVANGAPSTLVPPPVGGLSMPPP
eukprot:CAMPEP_0113888686 /NCGR_PEP_ID=MMETSP0780_2-20120614/13014_1 /TAXON_ID=652834 /ORGANISM="Palpitomonas bilix" /LENGTH=89 /DNA_ID=CAMNT_0000877571 /DNA_START=30 /DNA_END=296 /DNA_ORIENTATION=+ /assembly_acc=CAM_ASM_000599